MANNVQNIIMYKYTESVWYSAHTPKSVGRPRKDNASGWFRVRALSPLQCFKCWLSDWNSIWQISTPNKQATIALREIVADCGLGRPPACPSFHPKPRHRLNKFTDATNSPMDLKILMDGEDWEVNSTIQPRFNWKRICVPLHTVRYKL